MSENIVAHLIIEAKTALRFGSSSFCALQDSPIMRDFNGLPFILGTSLCGILRDNAKTHLQKTHANAIDELFGTREKASKLIFSNALLLDENMQVCEFVKPKSEFPPFLQHFVALPQRQHNAMSDKGACEVGAKFDEEVIYKGARFKFSLQMRLENDAQKELFFELLSLFNASVLRLGSGASKGLGRVSVRKISYELFKTKEAHRFSSSLNAPLSQNFTPNPLQSVNFTHYKLNLTPENVFIFGSGYGDEDADSVGVREKVVDYESANLTSVRVLIPASSIKGALSHRTLFYINENLGNFIDTNKANSAHSENTLNLDEKAAQIHTALFGSTASKGKILISDIYLNGTKTQIFTHNSIDRLSGAVKDGALFQEKTNALPKNSAFCLDISVQNSDTADFKLALSAFEKALKDLCCGLLPLGAMSSKGHGFFNATLEKNGAKYGL